MNHSASFKALIEQAVAETGVSLEISSDDLGRYMAERAEHLATLVDDPGFDFAARAERDNIALKAGVGAWKVGRAVDQQFVGILQGGLIMDARLIT